YALAGLALGLTHYFYEGGRLFFTPMVGLWLAVGWWVWRPCFDPRGAVVTLVTALLVAVPQYYTTHGLQAESAGRLARTRVPDAYWGLVFNPNPEPEALRALADRVQQPWLQLVAIPDSSAFFGGDGPLLLLPFAVCAMLGFVFALWGWRTPGYSALLLWIVGPLLSMVVLVDPGQSIRLSVALPGLVVLGAVGLRYGVARLTAPIIGRRWAWPLMAVLAIGLSFGQGYWYVEHHLPAYNTQIRLDKTYPDVDDAMLRLAADYGPETQIVLVSANTIPTQYAVAILLYVWNTDQVGVQSIQPWELTPEFLDARLLNAPYVFFIQPDDAHSRALLLAETDATPRGPSPYEDVIPPTHRLHLYEVAPLTVDDLLDDARAP
ncbi:MAG: hypothetical protein ACLFTK_11510, partial [Anaerolineales bacterium]